MSKREVNFLSPAQLAKRRPLKDKFTLYLSCDEMSALRRISKQKGIALSRVIDAAIKMYVEALQGGA
jgi:hypothetical protein